jgi:WD40 repeat protein
VGAPRRARSGEIQDIRIALVSICESPVIAQADGDPDGDITRPQVFRLREWDLSAPDDEGSEHTLTAQWAGLTDDGEWAVVFPDPGTVVAYSTSRPETAYSTRLPIDRMTSMAAHGSRIIGGYAGGDVRILNVDGGEVQLFVVGGDPLGIAFLYPLALSPTGSTLATSYAREVRLRDVSEQDDVGQLLLSRVGKPLPQDGWPAAIALSLDDRRLASAVGDTLSVWDVETGALTDGPIYHPTSITNMVFHPTKADTVLAQSQDGFMRAWRLRDSVDHVQRLTSAPAYRAVPDTNSRWLAVVSGGIVRLWDAETLKPVKDLAMPGLTCVNATFDLTGRLLGVSANPNPWGTRGEWVQVWDVETGEPVWGPVETTDARSLAFTADGAALFSAGATTVSKGYVGVTQSWDARTGRALAEPFLASVYVAGGSAVSAHPREPLISIASLELSTGIWDHGAQRLTDVVMRHTARVFTSRFSPNGVLLATGSHNGMAQLWDHATGAPVGPALGHDSSVMHVAFSPDGAYLATGSMDRSVRLWEVSTGEMIGPPLRLEGTVGTVEFDAQGRRLFIAGLSGVHVWTLPELPANVEEMRRRTLRALGAKMLDGEIVSMSADEWARSDVGRTSGLSD